MACLVAAGPAKKAAGSPGRARISTNVTTTPPARPGAAASSRRPTSRSTSVLRELTEVELSVEPVLVARDALLHRHVEVGLVERHPRDLRDGELGECHHQLRILLR